MQKRGMVELDTGTKRAMTLSISGHVLVVIIGFVLTLVHISPREEEPIVIELVDLSAAEAMPVPTTASPKRAVEPEPEIKKIHVPEFAALPEVPDVQLPEPEPPPKPAPKPDAPKPEAPVKETKTVSYEEWAKNRNLPKQVETSKPTKRDPVKINKIDTNIREALNSSLSNLTVRDSRVSSNPSALSSYLSAVHARIQAAFKPLGAGLSAEVSFNIEVDGRITGVQFIRKSGNTAFDNSVLDAFKRVRSPGPPPDNRSLPLSIRFSSE